MTPFEYGFVAHLIADWLLQNEWMAVNKHSLRHPASWVHAAIHALCLGVALDPLSGFFLGVIHLLIDTRIPLNWWFEFYKQTSPTIPENVAVTVWTDQALHIVTLAAWVAFYF